MSFCSNCLLFGAVAGSVIGCLWNSVHSPEKKLLEQLCAFRGCGGTCQAHVLLIGCFWNSVHSPESKLLEQFFASRGCGRIWQARFVFIGCFWNSIHSPENELLKQFFALRGYGWIWQARFFIHWLLFEFRPQPRQRAFGAILCFSGLWQDLTSTFCIDCHDCRQNPVQNPDRPGPDPNTRTRPDPDRANPDYDSCNFSEVFSQFSDPTTAVVEVDHSTVIGRGAGQTVRYFKGWTSSMDNRA